MRALILAIICSFIGFTPALAQETAKGLMASDSIPSEFRAVDSLGRDTTYPMLKGKNGLILLFTRSADWCQYCKAQLADWNQYVKKADELGYKIAAISYDKPAVLQHFSDQHSLKYTLLSDKNSAMIKAFGIRNTKFDEGSRFYGIPNPAIYVIDDYGKIKHVFREEGYKDRPSPNEIFTAISSTTAPDEPAGE